MPCFGVVTRLRIAEKLTAFGCQSDELLNAPYD